MTPEELIEAAKCYGACLSEPGVVLYLLDQLRIQGGGSTLTMAQLADAAKCYNCIPDQAAAQTYLLDQILTQLG